MVSTGHFDVSARRFPGAARRVVVVLAMVVAVVAATLVVAAPAEAATCGSPGCGGSVRNVTSSRSVYVANCWSGSQDRVSGTAPPCATNGLCWGCVNAYYYVQPNQETTYWPSYYDVDAFRVDAGCFYQGYGTYSGPFAIDQRSRNYHLWQKIISTDHIYVTAITCN